MSNWRRHPGGTASVISILITEFQSVPKATLETERDEIATRLNDRNGSGIDPREHMRYQALRAAIFAKGAV